MKRNETDKEYVEIIGSDYQVDVSYKVPNTADKFHFFGVVLHEDLGTIQIIVSINRV